MQIYSYFHSKRLSDTDTLKGSLGNAENIENHASEAANVSSQYNKINDVIFHHGFKEMLSYKRGRGSRIRLACRSTIAAVHAMSRWRRDLQPLLLLTFFTR